MMNKGEEKKKERQPQQEEEKKKGDRGALSSPSTEPRQLKIRELEASDLGKGFLDALAHLSDLGNLSMKEAEDILQRTRRNPHHHVLVAVKDDGQVVGTTTLLVEQKFIHRGGLVGHIEDVSVRPDHEGKGIGSSVVKAAVDMARAIGCYKVILDCKPENVKFYERIGFRRYEEGMRIDLTAPQP